MQNQPPQAGPATESPANVSPPRDTTHDQRDIMSFFLLGGFFAVMAVLVLIGTFWTLGKFHAMVVNLVSGLVLLAVGVGMLAFGLRLKHRRSPTGSKLP